MPLRRSAEGQAAKAAADAPAVKAMRARKVKAARAADDAPKSRRGYPRVSAVETSRSRPKGPGNTLASRAVLGPFLCGKVSKETTKAVGTNALQEMKAEGAPAMLEPKLLR